MSNMKERTFVKQVERTAKRDAYLTAIRYVKEFGLEHGLRVLKEKADSHTLYLSTMPLVYDYATQTLVTRENGIDGVKVDAAMSSLSKSIAEEIKS
jgi:hypothetical protein